MREGTVGLVFLAHILVGDQVEHFLEFLPVHEDVGVQERIATNVASESSN